MIPLETLLRQQLNLWHVAVPIPGLAADEKWLPLACDAATTLPDAAWRQAGRPILFRTVTLTGDALDLAAVAGQLPDDASQACAITQLVVDADVTLGIEFDFDWRAVVWLDGRELIDCRDGNGGHVGRVRHRLLVGLGRGTHTLCVRIISGSTGWGLFWGSVIIRPGIDDVLNTGPDAHWRNYTRSRVRLEARPDLDLPGNRCHPLPEHEMQAVNDWSTRAFREPFPYAATARMRARNWTPATFHGDMPLEGFEELCANCGIDARWIAVVDRHGDVLYRSAHLPAPDWVDLADSEARLKRWVETLHRNRLAAVSWYPLTLNSAAWDVHPDWRQEYLDDGTGRPAQEKQCCVNSPYGDALIRFVVEALETFDLDGFWFDGTYLSARHPEKVSCCCRHCRDKFRQDSGLELPRRLDWSLPQFPAWVKWRYAFYAAYLERLAAAVRAARPHATLAFNNYHRENMGWTTGLAWRRSVPGWLPGTEADAAVFKGLWHARLMRAFGAGHAEVWLGMNDRERQTPKGLRLDTRQLMEFALACVTGGGVPSFGANARAPVHLPVFVDIAAELRRRAPYSELPSHPHIALHLSEQTETFVFGRNPAYPGGSWRDVYGHSCSGWHNAIAHGGLFCDVIFDDSLTPEALSRYRIVVSPYACALAPTQEAALEHYVAAGGIWVTGPWAGCRDEWGNPRPATAPPIFSPGLPHGGAFPSFDALNTPASVTFTGVGPDGLQVTARAETLGAVAVPPDGIALTAGNDALMSTVSHGRGRVVKVAFDLGLACRRGNSGLFAAFVGAWFRSLAAPPVELDFTDAGLVLGVFDVAPNRVIVHVQRLTPPWQETPEGESEPTWGVRLLWRGRRPKSVRTLLPAPGPALSLKRVREAYAVELPPFTWGQVVEIETAGPGRRKCRWVPAEATHFAGDDK